MDRSALGQFFEYCQLPYKGPEYPIEQVQTNLVFGRYLTFFMPSHKGHRGAYISVGERHPGIGGCR